MATARTPEQRQHMHDVADAIETHENRFDMTVFSEHRPECGTVMCIAGWSDHLLGRSTERVRTSVAAAVMGLSQSDAVDLFCYSGVHASLRMPKHLRAKGMADAVRQIADGATVRNALKDVAERYV